MTTKTAQYNPLKPKTEKEKMAQRGKAINVKIATTKVIKALETALEKLNKDYASQEANQTKHDKARKAWAKEIAQLAVKHIAKAENFQANKRWNNTIDIDFSIPAGTIEIPNEPTIGFLRINDWDYRQQKQEIENAIRILKMTDEEVVSTSTYNAIARYL